jgi:hypothetical protein
VATEATEAAEGAIMVVVITEVGTEATGATTEAADITVEAIMAGPLTTTMGFMTAAHITITAPPTGIHLALAVTAGTATADIITDTGRS